MSKMAIRSIAFESTDAIVMISNGVTDNLTEDRLHSIIYNLIAKESNKAKVIVEMASILALGVGVTPHSSRAAQSGFFVEGGRSDDASAVVIKIQQYFAVNDSNNNNNNNNNNINNNINKLNNTKV